MKIIIMGPQGSGKSTQAGLLGQELTLPHLQTGEACRQISKKAFALGQRVKKAIEEGKLVSDTDLFTILESELAKKKYQGGFILDGSPRTISQAKNLPFKPDRVFYLKVKDEENIKRLLKRSRADDTLQLINQRLALYHQETEPILAFYQHQGILEEVDGEKSIEAIQEDIRGRFQR